MRRGVTPYRRDQKNMRWLWITTVSELGGLNSSQVRVLPQFGKQLRVQDWSLPEAWWPNAEERGIENIGNSPVEIVEVELK